MRLSFFYVVIIGLWATSGYAADSTPPKSQPVHASITKVFHEHLPAKSPPRLMRDVIGGADVDWSAAALRSANHETGEDFLVTWSASATEKLVIRFEYRQERKTDVKVKEQSNIKLRGQSHFSVKSDEFQTGGAVTAWRVTILDGEKVLVSKQSFMW